MWVSQRIGLLTKLRGDLPRQSVGAVGTHSGSPSAVPHDSGTSRDDQTPSAADSRVVPYNAGNSIGVYTRRATYRGPWMYVRRPCKQQTSSRGPRDWAAGDITRLQPPRLGERRK